MHLNDEESVKRSHVFSDDDIQIHVVSTILVKNGQTTKVTVVSKFVTTRHPI